jgi:hypothetical protein
MFRHYSLPRQTGSKLSAAALGWDAGFCFTDFREHFLCFAGLPLRIVETLACLAEIHLAQTGLRVFYCA